MDKGTYLAKHSLERVKQPVVDTAIDIGKTRKDFEFRLFKSLNHSDGPVTD